MSWHLIRIKCMSSVTCHHFLSLETKWIQFFLKNEKQKNLKGSQVAKYLYNQSYVVTLTVSLLFSILSFQSPSQILQISSVQMRRQPVNPHTPYNLSQSPVFLNYYNKWSTIPRFHCTEDLPWWRISNISEL